MTRIIRNLAEIGGTYGVLFCDLWGCVHNGKMAYPAAIAALQAYRGNGGKVALVTNAPRPRGAVAEQVARLGVSVMSLKGPVTTMPSASWIQKQKKTH